MVLSKREIKQRYFEKVYRDAKIIKCACGCGWELKDKDHYGCDATFINGHNGRKYDNPTQYKREWNYRNRESRRAYRDNYQKKRKAELIQLMGVLVKNAVSSIMEKTLVFFNSTTKILKRKK